jgi:hypothetical protein
LPFGFKQAIFILQEKYYGRLKEEERIMKRGRETFTERLQRILETYDFEAILKQKDEAPAKYQENVENLLNELIELKKKNDHLKNMI